MALKGLGRGLESLIPASIKTEKQASQTQTVPITHIRVNRYQPRRHFNEASLQELSDSIREQGLIQPLIVTEIIPEDGIQERYELIAGERRWRASKMAGLTEIPVVIKKVSMREMLQFSLIENLQREDLNPIEEAVAFERLMAEFNLTQEEMARAVGKSRVVVANTLRLLNLPQFLKDAVANGTISAGHARNLISISDEKLQRELAEKILAEKMSVRDVEKVVSTWKDALAEGKITLKKRKDPEIRHLEEELQSKLGTKIEIRARGKGTAIKGSVIISYYSLDDLNRVIKILKESSQG